jgi:choline dehydrogenase-like flavoprotein
VFLDSSVVPVLLHPLSRGRIRLKSKHFYDHPIIEPNYLHHPLDVTTLADACLTAMKRWAALQAPRRCCLAFISMITTAVCCCNLSASACSVRLHEPMKSIAGSLVGGMRVQQSTHTLTPPIFCRSSGGSHSPLTLDLRVAWALQSFGRSTLGTISCPVSLLRGIALCSLFPCITTTCASFLLHLSLVFSFMTLTIYHPIGTAKMGLAAGINSRNTHRRFFAPRATQSSAQFTPLLSDATAVVDERLRVLGVQRLRVADASIMPTLSSGNTHAPVVHSRGMTMLQRV